MNRCRVVAWTLCFLLGASTVPIQAQPGSPSDASCTEAACSLAPSAEARCTAGICSESSPSVPAGECAGAGGEFEFDQTLGTSDEIDPFGPTPHEVVLEMLALADVGKDDVVYDLGSGDGRIPIAAAEKAGARGVGIELRAELVEKSRRTAEEAGVADRVRFIEGDIFKTEISDATAVLLYLFPRTLLKLRPKLLEELQPGARVVALNYGIEGWPRDKEQAVEYQNFGTLFYWIVPANVSGAWKGTLTIAPGDDRPLTLHLDQTFQQVSGKARSGDQEVPLADVTLQGDRLSFSLPLELPGAPGEKPLRLTGKVDGDRLQGMAAPAQAESGEGAGPRTWQAARDPATKTAIDPKVRQNAAPKP